MCSRLDNREGSSDIVSVFAHPFIISSSSTYRSRSLLSLLFSLLASSLTLLQRISIAILFEPLQAWVKLEGLRALQRQCEPFAHPRAFLKHPNTNLSDLHRILTIASFVCLVLIEISGWNSGALRSYYFMQVNFTYADTSSASEIQNTTSLSTALEGAKDQIADLYEIHLWNYCESNKLNGEITHCSPRKGEFVFDPIAVWHLNKTSAATGTSTSSASNPIESAADKFKDKTEEIENNLLGDTARKALDAYRKIAKVMFILYAVSFWTTAATIFLGIFAIFSRWGSLCTWIFAFVSYTPLDESSPPLTFYSGFLLLQPRCSRSKHSTLRCHDWRVERRIRQLQHRRNYWQTRTRSYMAQCDLLMGRNTLLALQHLLLFWSQQPTP